MPKGLILERRFCLLFGALLLTPIAFAQSASPSPPTTQSRWRVHKSENDLDHVKQISLDDGRFYLRCSPKFEGYITPPLPDLGHRLDTDSNYRQQVRFRIDAGPVREESWGVSEDFEALFIPESTLREIVVAAKLVVEYKPDYVTARTATLNLAGLSAAAEKAGWGIAEESKRLKEQRDSPHGTWEVQCSPQEIASHNAYHPEAIWAADMMMNGFGPKPSQTEACR